MGAFSSRHKKGNAKDQFSMKQKTTSTENGKKKEIGIGRHIKTKQDLICLGRIYIFQEIDQEKV